MDCAALTQELMDLFVQNIAEQLSRQLHYFEQQQSKLYPQLVQELRTLWYLHRIKHIVRCTPSLDLLVQQE